MREIGRRGLLGAGAAIGAAGTARAQPLLSGANAWPTRPVRMVIPFAPGGPTDTYARLLCEHLARVTGQPFVAENRAGATGAIGTSFVARAAPDGHTLLFASNSSHVLGPLLARPPSFDPVRDFAPVAMVLSCPFYLLTNAGLPVRTVAEFVAHGRGNPGRLNYASPGVGSGGHLVGLLVCQQLGIEAVHVPYAGAGPALLAVTNAEAQFFADTVGTSQPMVNEGKLRGLAVLGQRREPAVPAVPTMTESGYPGLEAELWFGLLAPAGTSAPLVAALNAEVGRFVAQPAVWERMAGLAFTPTGGPPEAFSTRIRGETERWTNVVRIAGLSGG